MSRACHHWWCFALLIGLFVCCIFSQEEKIIRPHHQNGYSLILPVTIPYPLLSWGLSFSQLDKVSYTYRKIGLYATRQNQRHNNND